MIERLLAALMDERGWEAVAGTVRRMMQWVDEHGSSDADASAATPHFILPGMALGELARVARERGWTLPAQQDQLRKLPVGGWEATLEVPDFRVAKSAMY